MAKNVKLSTRGKGRKLTAMFEEKEVSSSALFTFLVGRHARAVSLPPSDAALSHLAYPLKDVIFLFILGDTTLSLYKH
jgi:hypothetical protein